MARTLAQLVSRVLWLGALLSAGVGALGFYPTVVWETIVRSESGISAPQLAALAGASLAWAAVPYCLARAWDELTRPWLRPDTKPAAAA